MLPRRHSKHLDLSQITISFSWHKRVVTSTGSFSPFGLSSKHLSELSTRVWWGSGLRWFESDRVAGIYDEEEYYCTGSALAALTVFLLVCLLYRHRRSLPGRFRPLSALYHLLCQALEKILDVVAWLGTGFAEGQLVFIGWMERHVPKAWPS